MFDPERLLGQLLVNGLSGRSRRSGLSPGTKGTLGMGLLGVAMAAYEHFSQQKSQISAAPADLGSSLPTAAPTSSMPANAAPLPARNIPQSSMTPPPLPGAPIPAPIPAPSRPVSPVTVPPVPSHPAAARPSLASPVASGAARSDSPPTQLTQADQALWLIRAMVAAAAADGEMDATERNKILDAAANSGMSSEDISVFVHELDSPRSILELASVGTTPAMCHQLYAASLLAITVDTEAEKQFLNRLASALKLSVADVENIHQQLGE